jgi:hypothetical protein
MLSSALKITTDDNQSYKFNHFSKRKVAYKSIVSLWKSISKYAKDVDIDDDDDQPDEDDSEVEGEPETNGNPIAGSMREVKSDHDIPSASILSKKSAGASDSKYVEAKKQEGGSTIIEIEQRAKANTMHKAPKVEFDDTADFNVSIPFPISFTNSNHIILFIYEAFLTPKT